MPTHTEQADLPYSQQQVYDLVADIERYPQFLPHLASARIVQRRGNILWVDQVVRVNLLRLPFRTRAVLEPPGRIHVVCSDSPFGSFSDQWSFAPLASGGTRLRCHTEFEFHSSLLRGVMGMALGGILRTTVKAFEKRARQLYGNPAATQGGQQPG